MHRTNGYVCLNRTMIGLKVEDEDLFVVVTVSFKSDYARIESYMKRARRSYEVKFESNYARIESP